MKTIILFSLLAISINAQNKFAVLGILMDEGYVELLGEETVFLGDMSNEAAWTYGTGWSFTGGVASCDGSQATLTDLYQSFPGITSGKVYRVEFDLTVSAGSMRHWCVDFLPEVETVTGHYSFLFTSAHTFLTFTGDADFIGTIDNVSIKEVLNP